MENLRWKFINGSTKLSPRFISIGILAVVFVIYFYSILQGRFYLGQADPSSRFLIAMDYAHHPGDAFDLSAWLSVWPPIPFIIQGFILRCLLFLGLRTANSYIFAVQIIGVVLLVVGIYFIGRTVALQTDEITGLLAVIFCLSARTLLYFAPSTLSEVYTFVFISLAFWNLFRFIKYRKGLGWSAFFFVAAFFCRTESLVLAFAAGIYLIALRQRRPAALLLGIMIAVILLKVVGSMFLISGVKFFQYGSLYGWSSGKYSLQMTQTLIVQLWSNNQKFILLSCLSLLPIAYYLFRYGHPSLVFAGNGKLKSVFQLSPARKFSLSRIPSILDEVAFDLARVPLVFWIVMFIVTIGILVEQALQGNINAQSRYLYNANVFLVVTVAILVAGSLKIIWAGKDRLVKTAALGGALAIVLFSLWSGFSLATARRVPWSMPPEMKDLIHFVQAHSRQGDRVAFDFLLWQETPLQVELLDPSQPTKIESEPGLSELIPDGLQAPNLWVAYMHAFIHVKHPKFLVIASPSLWESIQVRSKVEMDINSDIPVDQIRGYLTPVKDSNNEFIFQSSYIFPDETIEYQKVYENASYVVMELK